MKGKLSSLLKTCTYEAIGLYVYLHDYAKNLDLATINSHTLVTEFIGSLKPANNLDALLVELESNNLIRYELHSVTILSLEPKEKRDHSLDAALSGTWLAWVEYKANEKKSSYKSPESERRAYTQLLKDCGNDETLAAGALVNAMAMGWHGANVDVYLKRLNNLKKVTNENTTKQPKLGRIDTGELQQWLNS